MIGQATFGVSLSMSVSSCNSLCMTEQTNSTRDPEWDVADRMRKALRTADVGVQEMATYLGVARNTVSTWINGRIHPDNRTLRLWALRCGVRYEWLTGDELCAAPAKTAGAQANSHRNSSRCTQPHRQPTRPRRVHRRRRSDHHRRPTPAVCAA